MAGYQFQSRGRRGQTQTTPVDRLALPAHDWLHALHARPPLRCHPVCRRRMCPHAQLVCSTAPRCGQGSVGCVGTQREFDKREKWAWAALLWDARTSLPSAGTRSGFHETGGHRHALGDQAHRQVSSSAYRVPRQVCRLVSLGGSWISNGARQLGFTGCSNLPPFREQGRRQSENCRDCVVLQCLGWPADDRW